MLLLAAIVLSGVWDATVVFDGRSVPFQMEFTTKAGRVQAAVIEGPKRHRTTSGTFDGRKLELHWDFYDSVLTATYSEGKLTGEYVRLTKTGRIPRPFEARPAVRRPDPKPAADLTGEYVMATDAPGGRRVMQATLKQKGSQVTGTIQAVDGDFGYMAGSVDGTKLVMSNFDLVRGSLLEADYDPATCTLRGIVDRKTKFEARNARCGHAPVAEVIDPRKYTWVHDPSEPFRFTLPDLEGKPVSLTDDRFRNKVVIVTIMGSWCPNCHDEAPFYEELYKKYRQQGLEVISLAFEYTGEAERDRAQVRRFRDRHGVTYTMLLAGTTDDGEVQRKLPQLKNFAAFPTTIILDRSHKVHLVEAGFAGPANPAEHAKMRREVDQMIRGLLAR